MRKPRKHNWIIAVFCFTMFLFWGFNMCNIIREVNLYSVKAAGFVKDIQQFRTDPPGRKKGYRITVSYIYEGIAYDDVEMTYFPELGGCQVKAGEVVDISINKKDHGKAMYKIWSDNGRGSSLAVSIVFLILFIWMFCKLF